MVVKSIGVKIVNLWLGLSRTYQLVHGGAIRRNRARSKQDKHDLRNNHRRQWHFGQIIEIELLRSDNGEDV